MAARTTTDTTRAAVLDATLSFERRWTIGALRRVDPELFGDLMEQKAYYVEACERQDAADMKVQGESLVRGWKAAIATMERAGTQDDAYLIGKSKNGMTIAIGHQKASADYLSAKLGRAVVWFSPDELADICDGLDEFQAVANVKRLFPGAELIEVEP